MTRLTVLVSVTFVAACSSNIRQDVDQFIRQYEETYQDLVYEANLAEWETNTRIVEGDTTNAARTRAANEALAAFVGSVDNIERIRSFLDERTRLTGLQARTLDAMLYQAAASPQTIPEVVRSRIAAEARQVEQLFGYEFRIDGQPITPNQIDAELRTARDDQRRRKVWEASKAVGPTLQSGIVELRELRNATVRPLGYDDFFAYQVSDYGLSTADMLALTDALVRQTRPLYRELHTWARFELASRFGRPVPELIPAHWLPNRWAQDWTALIAVEGVDVDGALRDETAEWVVRQAEGFFVSLGFEPLPSSFWERSSLYPLPPNAPFKKNTHASAWHLDLADDVRSLMSVEPDRYWYETAHHELGHIYYYESYSVPDVPLVLRRGANRAYHEGIGSLLGLASLQQQFLVGRGLLTGSESVDPVQQLLVEALNHIVFIPFAAGTMTRFEHQLYTEELPAERFNAAWWDLVRRYQGVEPPGPRPANAADALTKTHINDDPAQYYDYALSAALLFQLHEHISREILGQDPHNTDYYGSPAVGQFLKDLMQPGASRPWPDVLRETTGRDLDAQAMVDYFAPLYDWLLEQNRGRVHTLPAMD